MGLYATCLAHGPPVLRDATADSTLVTELQERIEEKRETITKVPGEGNVLGVLDHDDQIDIENALGDLELELTPLDETLRKVLLSAEST